jgi:sugar fermentation stimulation protein A
MFPDAVTQRGLKHIEILRTLKQAGFRAVLLYCVQHTGIRRVHLAHNIDSAYADAVRSAIAEGVEVIAMKVVFRPPHGWLSRELPFDPDAGRL